MQSNNLLLCNDLKSNQCLQFPRIVDACASYLAEALHPENCVGILHLADVHSLESLKAQVYTYIIQNFSQVVDHDEILELPADVLVSLLQHDDLGVTEEEQVFDVVMRWLRARQDERKAQLPRVLTHVRLPLLDPWYFVERVEGDSLIRQCAEVFPLLQEARVYHLSGKEVSFTKVTFLNAWCHVEVVTRHSNTGSEIQA